MFKASTFSISMVTSVIQIFSLLALACSAISYIVMDEKTKETMVIDPGGDCNAILEMLEILGGNLKYIYLTLRRRYLLYEWL